jgi:hypothetical protein
MLIVACVFFCILGMVMGFIRDLRTTKTASEKVAIVREHMTEGELSQDEDEIPEDEGDMPQDDGEIPQDEGEIPQDENDMPETEEGEMPQDEDKGAMQETKEEPEFIPDCSDGWTGDRIKWIDDKCKDFLKMNNINFNKENKMRTCNNAYYRNNKICFNREKKKEEEKSKKNNEIMYKIHDGYDKYDKCIKEKVNGWEYERELCRDNSIWGYYTLIDMNSTTRQKCEKSPESCKRCVNKSIDEAKKAYKKSIGYSRCFGFDQSDCKKVNEKYKRIDGNSAFKNTFNKCTNNITLEDFYAPLHI